MAGAVATLSSRRDWLAFALYGSAALGLAFVDYAARGNPAYVVERFIPAVLSGSYEAPFIYRPLAPWLIQTVTSLCGLSPIAGLVLVRLAGLLTAFVTFHVYVRAWYPSGVALAATLTMAALLPLTFTNSWPVPGTYLELTLFSLGCLAIARGRDGLFAVVFIVAAFNRETSAFLGLLWAVVRFRALEHRTWLLRGAALGAAWVAVFAGLRLAWGFRPYKFLVLWQNLDYLQVFDSTIEVRLRIFGWFWLAILAVPTVLAVRGARLPDAPPMARDATGVALVFIATCLVTASIVETRVLVPVFPLLAPAALHFATTQTGSLLRRPPDHSR